MDVVLDEATEVASAGVSAAAVVTCEHASERLPAPWSWPDEDRWLVGTHWAYDLGARDFALEITRAIGAVGVLARFSRLLVDPNRTTDAVDLFRTTAEGKKVALNASIDADERARRLALFDGYHAAVAGAVAASPAKIVFSVHTFTPVYEGAKRAVELGVLFDDEQALAEALAERLSRAGFVVALNEPYSGKSGLIYSAERHARSAGRRALELEMRQDLAVEPSTRARAVDAVADFLRNA
ncbi:MAG TPA: N-formylglutamate amidohydrolase [Polyangiaceae bacterium]|jgi:predicted N-formylglutamate amidohydrolase|nr:N-formylglutamate amidohydrolase [Polyangiaceae bacterium]